MERHALWARTVSDCDEKKSKPGPSSENALGDCDIIYNIHIIVDSFVEKTAPVLY